LCESFETRCDTVHITVGTLVGPLLPILNKGKIMEEIGFKRDITNCVCADCGQVLDYYCTVK
jgi:hypothetical protein